MQGLNFINEIKIAPKISHLMNSEDFKIKLVKVLTVINTLQGISTEIGEVQKMDLLNMIEKKYRDLAISEIFKAFELERYLDLPPKSNHYNVLSVDYVSEVLLKYKDWKQKQIRSIIKITEQKEVTQSEKNTLKLKLIGDVYAASKKQQVHKGAWLLYEDLKTHITTSSEEKKVMFESVLNNEISKLKNKLVKTPLDPQLKAEIKQLESREKVEHIKNICRSIEVCRFANSLDIGKFTELNFKDKSI
jgi:hypothetical protein